MNHPHKALALFVIMVQFLALMTVSFAVELCIEKLHVNRSGTKELGICNFMLSIGIKTDKIAPVKIESDYTGLTKF